MRYFFLAYLLVAVGVIAVGGFRSDKFKHTPIEVFPDMDHQPKPRFQGSTPFFGDRVAGRRPVEETVPMGFKMPSKPSGEAGPDLEGFANGVGYLSTGHFGEYYGKGFPKEIEINQDLIDLGREKFNINCKDCHGYSGNGQGPIAKYGLAVANLVEARLGQDSYPNGQLYHVIVHGKGNMGPYGALLNLKERWAIVAYVRALQTAAAAPAAEAAGDDASGG